MKTTMRTEEGKGFTLVLEHTMDMNENSFHFHYRLLHKLKYIWKKGVKFLQRKFNNKREISLRGSPNPK